MKIIDRYLLRVIIRSLALSFALFIGIQVIEESFRILPKLQQHKDVSKILIHYLILRLPRIFSLMAPLAVLFGSMIALSTLARRGEIISMLVCTIPPRRIGVPIFISSLFLCMLCVGLSNFVMPPLEKKKDMLLSKGIRSSPHYKKGDYFVSIKEFSSPYIYDVWVKKMKKGAISLYIYSKEGVYEGGSWYLKDVEIYRLEDGVPLSSTKDTLRIDEDIIYQPRDLSLFIEDDYLVTPQLLAKAKLIDGTSWIFIHLRIAFPFAIILCAILAFTILMKHPLLSFSANFAISLLLAFLYWGILSICVELGESGTLAAWLASWLPNLFLVIVLFGIKLI